MDGLIDEKQPIRFDFYRFIDLFIDLSIRFIDLSIRFIDLSIRFIDRFIQ